MFNRLLNLYETSYINCISNLKFWFSAQKTYAKKTGNNIPQAVAGVAMGDPWPAMLKNLTTKNFIFCSRFFYQAKA